MFNNTGGLKGFPRGNSGQGTVEYIVLVTAVITVIILFANSNNTGLRGKLNNTIDNLSDGIVDRGEFLGNQWKTPDGAATWTAPDIGLVTPSTNEFTMGVH